MKNTWLTDFQEKTNLNKYPIAHRFNGGIGYLLPNGDVVSNFVGHPVHYEESGEMKPITLDWIPTTGEFEGSWFGWDTVKKCPTYCGYELYTPKAIKWNGLYYPLNFLRLENRMIADTPIGTYEIIYSESGMKELITIPESVEGTLELDAPEQSGWDEYLYINPRRIVNGEQAGNVFKLTKDMQYPLQIDPDYSSSTADGNIYGYNATYATARSTSYNTYIYNIEVLQNLSGGIYIVQRAATLFLTSGIPDTDVVSAVTMSIYCSAKSTTPDWDIQIVKYDWNGLDVSTNKETIYDGILAGSLDDSVWKNTSAVTAGNMYASGALDTSWVNKTGSTYYGLMSSRDRSNTAPSGLESVTLSGQDDGTPSRRPYLTVTHAAADTGLYWFF